MKRTIASLAFAVAAMWAIVACTALQQVGLPSPEAQITAGAQAGAAATATTTDLLRAHKITVAQAKGYRNMLAAAPEGLKDANTDLVACRSQTGSDHKTSPDPCWPRVQDVVLIALENVASIKRTVDAKK